jgi:hypothetical protein
MAVISSDLYYLLARMNRTEKAYFSKFGYKYEKEEKPEITLFEILDKLCIDEEIDEETIEEKAKKAFLKKQRLANFSKTKTNLYTDILHALRQYEKSKMNDEKAFEFYQFANILINKNLFKEALVFLRKAEKICIEFEFFELQILINQLQAFAMLRISSMKKDDTTLTLIQESYLTVKSFLETLNTKKEYFELAFLQKEKGIVNSEQEIALLQEKENLLKDMQVESASARLYQLQALSTIALLQSNQVQSMEYYEQIINLLNDKNTIKQINLFKYISIYDQFLQNLLLSFKLEMFEEKVKAFNIIEVVSEQDIAGKENASIFLFSIYAILSNQLALYDTLSDRFEKLLEKSAYFIPGYRKISIAYYMVSGFFMQNNYDKATDWFNYINNNRKLGVRYDVDVASRIMSILSFIHLGQYDIADIHFKNLKNFFDKNSRFELDKIAVAVISKLISETNPVKRKKAIEGFIEKVQEIIKENPIEMQFLGVFDLLSYLEAQENGSSFYVVWRKRNLGK